VRGIRLEVPHALDKERLDVVIARLAPEISRRLARRLIDEGAVLVDGQRIQVQSRVVRAGTTIDVHVPDAPAAPNQAAPADAAPFAEILAIDSSLVVVGKPVGMPTEPTRQGARGTLLPLLEATLIARGESVSFLAAVHRLDTHTSGVVVFARSRYAAAAVGAQLADERHEDRPERRYLALVEGVPEWNVARMDAPLAKRPSADGRVYATPIERGGAPAVTLVTVLARGDGAALLLCSPITGRTHQIRVHLADAGLPLVDDRRYARPAQPSAHPGLHALSIAIAHPVTNARIRYTAPPPASFFDACATRGITNATVSAVLAAEAGMPAPVVHA
jgi:23S rRNA pseudouridine1911/1915/1917 synthase